MHEILESAPRYGDWIFSLASPYLGKRVLEVGAGSGTMFKCVLDREHAVAVEINPRLVKELERRFDSRPNVTVVDGNINDRGVIERLRSLRIDSVMTFNVLEHIDDHQMALQSIASVLDPGGSLSVLVPAFPSIFGAMDQGVGHVRRYRRPGLVKKMQAAGFSVIAAYYVNMPGYLAWFINGRVLRANSPAGGPRLVSFCDRSVIPATRHLEKFVHPPCGQSLFVVGRRL